MTGRGEPPRRLHDGFAPGRHAIEAFGGGGFRFAGMSHRGAILCLPSGVAAWSVAGAQVAGAQVVGAVVDAGDLARLLQEKDEIDLLILGGGKGPVALTETARWALREARIAAEAMATGHAVGAYNLLLGEGRRVAAALLPVDVDAGHPI